MANLYVVHSTWNGIKIFTQIYKWQRRSEKSRRISLNAVIKKWIETSFFFHIQNLKLFLRCFIPLESCTFVPLFLFSFFILCLSVFFFFLFIINFIRLQCFYSFTQMNLLLTRKRFVVHFRCIQSIDSDVNRKPMTTLLQQLVFIIWFFYFF